VKRLLVALLFVPQQALACSVCYSANEANRMAFLDTTIFLSLFPLLMIGGIAWWIWRQVIAAQIRDGE
jgi:hypothetical protein